MPEELAEALYQPGDNDHARLPYREGDPKRENEKHDREDRPIEDAGEEIVS